MFTISLGVPPNFEKMGGFAVAAKRPLVKTPNPESQKKCNFLVVRVAFDLIP